MALVSFEECQFNVVEVRTIGIPIRSDDSGIRRCLMAFLLEVVAHVGSFAASGWEMTS